MRKKTQTFIFSLLLFAFTFFTFHDYVLEFIDADTQHELCYLENDKSALDTASKVHASMQAIFDVTIAISLVQLLYVLNTKPLYFEKKFSSLVSFVLQKPPLSASF